MSRCVLIAEVRREKQAKMRRRADLVSDLSNGAPVYFADMNQACRKRSGAELAEQFVIEVPEGRDLSRCPRRMATRKLSGAHTGGGHEVEGGVIS